MLNKLSKGGAGLLCAFVATVATNVQAHHLNVVVGVGLVCKTADDLKKAIAVYDEGGDGLKAVNEEKPQSCIRGLTAYVLLKKVEEVTAKQGTLALMYIESVAVYTGVWQWVPNNYGFIATPVIAEKTAPTKPAGTEF